jgi:DNA-binding CsgD family transcriptional regulator/PAS domain-containing protein
MFRRKSCGFRGWDQDLATIDEFEPAFLMDLVGHIYEAAVDPEHWDQFLAALERVYPDARVTLFGHDSGNPIARLGASRNYATDDLRAYAEHYVRCSPYVARAAAVPVGEPIFYDSIIGDAELRSTEYYNDYLRPRRLGHYGTGLLIERDGTVGTLARRPTALSLADHRNDPDRRARQLRLLKLLAPHLTRAFRLHRTVAAEKINCDAARAAFDCWAHAALVLDASGRVVVMNRAAEQLLQRPDGLWLGRDGRLQSVDDTKTRALDTAAKKCAAIASAIDPESRPADLDGITLPRPSGAAPLRVMLAPLPFLGGEVSWDLADGTVLLLLFDPHNAPRTPVDWIARQYGLTPSEQRLAEAVINGVPLAEAAEQLGIRITTARTRLKVIQTKTDCRRQTDLVRLALSIPAVRPK